ncbi:MAG: hypothetical protein JWQ25_1929, partial [Daejeonella sp.]|nr:hypothetical protein [Daejeonella sp.]
NIATNLYNGYYSKNAGKTWSDATSNNVIPFMPTVFGQIALGNNSNGYLSGYSPLVSKNLIQWANYPFELTEQDTLHFTNYYRPIGANYHNGNLFVLKPKTLQHPSDYQILDVNINYLFK